MPESTSGVLSTNNWGTCVSIPHFLAAVFAVHIKDLPSELMLPDIKTLIPPGKDTPVHPDLLSYLPRDFGETVVAGSITYPKYPLKDSLYVITNKRWVLLNNFQEITLSAPSQQTIFDRAVEISHFGEEMFVEPFRPAGVPQTTILAHHLPSANDVLRMVEDKTTPLKPSTVFDKIPGDKHLPIKNWFAEHGDTIVQSMQFNTSLGSLSVNTSVTGGVLASYSKTGVNPQSLTFISFTDNAFTQLITDLLPETERANVKC